MVNNALNYNEGSTCANRIFVMVEDPDFQTRGYCYLWKIIPSGDMFFMKRILVAQLSGN
jgi:hypothetical protein